VADELAVAIDAARQADRALGRRRGELLEARTQLARAEQDVELGLRHHAGVLVQRVRDELRLRRRRLRPAARSDAAPLVSVLTAAYETAPDLLRRCLRSVESQTEPRWEHIVVDDGSASTEVARITADAARRDARVRPVRLDANRGIVAASSRALSEARGTYVALLDHDDELVPRSLQAMVAALEARPEAVMAYSDHALLRVDGRVASPAYKPDWSPERLRGNNYITHLVVARRDAVLRVGGFREGTDGSQDHDLVLRLGELGEVLHVPEVLYRWRESPASVATATANKPWAFDAGVRAVHDHCERVGIAATVERSAVDGVYRVHRQVPVPAPLVSVVIPTRGSSGAVWGVGRVHVVEAVRSMMERSTYRPVEFVVVADSVTPDEVLDELRAIAGDALSVVPFDEPFNFSAKINRGVAAAAGELLLVLNDDTELIEPGSVDEMVGLALEPGVGLVGAKLLFEDGTLQHAGHVYPGLVTHALLGFDGDHPGPNHMALLVRECSGVTAAAAMITRERFDAVGGFDEAYPSNFNDVDLSLRLRAAGLRNLWTPHAVWYHLESATRVPTTTDAERDRLLGQWSAEITNDPYFNPNLQPGRSDWLERPGRSGAPPYYRDQRGRLRFS
jgi:GT2 family glycosyltransferase